MDEFLDGYRRFRATAWAEHKDRFERLARYGQRPRALVIACSDSRVDPQMIFQSAPGELFSVRNVANLVPPYEPDGSYHGTSAAIEFAIKALEVPQILVIGHGHCGGVAALMRGTSSNLGDFVMPWTKIAEPARRRVMACGHTHEEHLQRAGEHACIELSMENLMTFPWIRDRVESGKLGLHGLWFDVGLGELHRRHAPGDFRPVEARVPDGGDAGL